MRNIDLGISAPVELPTLLPILRLCGGTGAWPDDAAGCAVRPALVLSRLRAIPQDIPLCSRCRIFPRLAARAFRAGSSISWCDSLVLARSIRAVTAPELAIIGLDLGRARKRPSRS